MINKVIAKTKENLQEIIQLEIKMNGNNCDLNHIDVSRTNDMNRIFANLKFNGDISNWNVSKVTNMNAMFYKSQFNGDISKWNVSNVTSMYGMFEESKFNGDLTKWLPYSLLKDKDAFKDCKALKPYWTNFDNVIDRNDSIKKYLLYSELNSNLHIKEHFTKINKI